MYHNNLQKPQDTHLHTNGGSTFGTSSSTIVFALAVTPVAVVAAAVAVAAPATAAVDHDRQTGIVVMVEARAADKSTSDSATCDDS